MFGNLVTMVSGVLFPNGGRDWMIQCGSPMTELLGTSVIFWIFCDENSWPCDDSDCIATHLGFHLFPLTSAKTQEMWWGDDEGLTSAASDFAVSCYGLKRWWRFWSKLGIVKPPEAPWPFTEHLHWSAEHLWANLENWRSATWAPKTSWGPTSASP